MIKKPVKISDLRGSGGVSFSEVEIGTYFLFDGILFLRIPLNEVGLNALQTSSMGDPRFTYFDPNATVQPVRVEILITENLN